MAIELAKKVSIQLKAISLYFYVCKELPSYFIHSVSKDFWYIYKNFKWQPVLLYF